MIASFLVLSLNSTSDVITEKKGGKKGRKISFLFLTRERGRGAKISLVPTI